MQYELLKESCVNEMRQDDTLCEGVNPRFKFLPLQDFYDKGIEGYNSLTRNAINERVYRRLCEMFPEEYERGRRTGRTSIWKVHLMHRSGADVVVLTVADDEAEAAQKAETSASDVYGYPFFSERAESICEFPWKARAMAYALRTDGSVDTFEHDTTPPREEAVRRRESAPQRNPMRRQMAMA